MRAYRRLRVRLKKADREKLDDVLSGGIQPVRTVLRALALGHLHEGKSVSEMPAFRVKFDVLPGRYTTAWFNPTKGRLYRAFDFQGCAGDWTPVR